MPAIRSTKTDDDIADFGVSVLLGFAAPRLYAAYGHRPADVERTRLREFRDLLGRQSGDSTAVQAALDELLGQFLAESGETVPQPIVRAARRALALLGHEKTDEAWDACGARILEGEPARSS